jgi:hypothetical protein
MALSADAAQRIEGELRTKAEILAYEIGNFVAKDAERAKAMYGEIIALLRDAVSPGTDFESDSEHPAPGRRPPLRLATKSGGGDETEEFILEIMANSPRGLSVQEIVERLQEAEIEIKRATLVVRLHRMVQAGKLTSRTHGHYVLSEAEHSRRQSA